MKTQRNSKHNESNAHQQAKDAIVDDHSHWAFDVEMHRKIELEAYFKAEQNGFAGDPQNYWIMAEKEVGCAMP
ncbi:MAG: DUF2934 domain-containing protein [Methylophilaceae bacterium]|jgi:hypothetical protein